MEWKREKLLLTSRKDFQEDHSSLKKEYSKNLLKNFQIKTPLAERIRQSTHNRFQIGSTPIRCTQEDIFSPNEMTIGMSTFFSEKKFLLSFNFISSKHCFFFSAREFSNCHFFERCFCTIKYCQNFRKKQLCFF